MISRRITPKRRGRRYLAALAATGLVAGTLLSAGAVLAVHDLDMQLDGDTTNTAWSPPVTPAPGTDWNDLFDASGNATTAIGLTHDFKHGDFTRDFKSKTGRNGACSLTGTGSTFCTADDTTYATGSKDTLPIVSGWQCNHDNNVNSKIDIMNAYSVSYVDPATDDRIIYFALEKNVDNGNNNVGFWFLQGDASCSSSSGTASFSGGHTDGDVLVVSAFTNGGGVSSITAYQWVGDATTGHLDPTPIGNGGDCKTATPPDSICATTNSGAHAFSGNITVPWLTANGGTVGHTVVPPDFFEGGVNLTNVFESTGEEAPSCFNTFIADTRSSQSLTATLFDFARGQLGECSATVTSTPSLTSTTLSSTDEIKDTADVYGTDANGDAGPDPTGTVSFFLCGPSATTCTSGGDAVGTAAVALGNCDPDAAGHQCATSVDARSLVTSTGTYCFRAVYNAGTDANYGGSNGALDGSSGECFTVSDSSGITTNQDWLPNDSATVTTGGSAVSGTVTFKLYEDGDCGTTAPTAVKATFTDDSPDSNGTFVTDNTSVYTSSQTISWSATFVSDNGVTGSTSSCETSSVTINNNH